MRHKRCDWLLRGGSGALPLSLLCLFSILHIPFALQLRKYFPTFKNTGSITIELPSVCLSLDSYLLNFVTQVSFASLMHDYLSCISLC